MKRLKSTLQAFEFARCFRRGRIVSAMLAVRMLLTGSTGKYTMGARK